MYRKKVLDSLHAIGFMDFGTLLRWLKFYPTEKELKGYMEKYDKKTLTVEFP